MSDKPSKAHIILMRPIYYFGYIVPKDYKHVMSLDDCNGNQRWYTRVGIVLTPIDKYKTFIDMDKDAEASKGSKRIYVQLVFDVKYDGRHKQD